MSGTKLRYLHVNELISRGQENRFVWQSLLGWKNLSEDGSDKAEIKSGKVINARMHIKRSGKEYDQHRI